MKSFGEKNVGIIISSPLESRATKLFLKRSFFPVIASISTSDAMQCIIRTIAQIRTLTIRNDVRFRSSWDLHDSGFFEENLLDITSKCAKIQNLLDE